MQVTSFLCLWYFIKLHCLAEWEQGLPKGRFNVRVLSLVGWLVTHRSLEGKGPSLYHSLSSPISILPPKIKNCQGSQLVCWKSSVRCVLIFHEEETGITTPSSSAGTKSIRIRGHSPPVSRISPSPFPRRSAWHTAFNPPPKSPINLSTLVLLDRFFIAMMRTY